MNYGYNMSPADYAAVSGNNGGLFGGNNDWLAALFLLPLFGGMWGGGFGGFGGGGILPWLLLGNGGWGGGNCGGGCATQADVRAAVDQQTLISKIDQQTYGLADVYNGLSRDINNNFRSVDSAICNLGYQTQQGFNGVERSMAGLGAQLSSCCCDIERSIDGNTNAGLMNTMNIQRQISDCCCDLEKANMQNRFDMSTYNCNTLQAIDKLGDRIVGWLEAKSTQDMRDELQTYKLAASQAKQTNELIGQLRPSPIPAYRVDNPYCCNNSCNYGNW